MGVCEDQVAKARCSDGVLYTCTESVGTITSSAEVGWGLCDESVADVLRRNDGS